MPEASIWTLPVNDVLLMRVIFPCLIPTSAISSRCVSGSMTRPPEMTVSKIAVGSDLACTAKPHTVERSTIKHSRVVLGIGLYTPRGS